MNLRVKTFPRVLSMLLKLITAYEVKNNLIQQIHVLPPRGLQEQRLEMLSGSIVATLEVLITCSGSRKRRFFSTDVAADGMLLMEFFPNLTKIVVNKFTLTIFYYNYKQQHIDMQLFTDDPSTPGLMLSSSMGTCTWTTSRSGGPCSACSCCKPSAWHAEKGGHVISHLLDSGSSGGNAACHPLSTPLLWGGVASRCGGHGCKTGGGWARIQSENRDGSRTILALFSTPIRPGWTRLVGQQIMVSSPDNEGGGRSVVGFVGSKMLPVWLAHLLGPLFLHQDLLFLHYQERAVMRQQLERKLKQQQRQQREGEEAAAASDVEGTDLSLPPPQYFTPGTADKAVAAWCTWLTKFAGGDVTYAPAGNGVLSVVLHAAGWLVGSWEGLGLLVVAAVAAGVVLVTTKLEQMMHKYEFSHADNH
ncbi:hypothetical protein VOLCADRAFT_100268 [Volvox carteri f. nagariensis]|uniref:Pheophorbide a oxygenase domain-containing protein n=1 Tax=Volvox carteri f. nagariensis TaxID=3068 RepID=D8UJV5_VOLCA|nr:uncharacterized protein VOLCADRAFT_100268 [Volvox carteri f. nagariensis]EFJ39988.1 hypothetical protein VOLCADRAFT_100268 [Volvox carteri f. nagariensis]|eukprot:XP_002958953.1 hypothetical protein VOLCADRAFT_100268 [Volvox carteri f. nagariensis]